MRASASCRSRSQGIRLPPPLAVGTCRLKAPIGLFRKHFSAIHLPEGSCIQETCNLKAVNVCKQYRHLGRDKNTQKTLQYNVERGGQKAPSPLIMFTSCRLTSRLFPKKTLGGWALLDNECSNRVDRDTGCGVGCGPEGSEACTLKIV